MRQDSLNIPNLVLMSSRKRPDNPIWPLFDSTIHVRPQNNFHSKNNNRNSHLLTNISLLYKYFVIDIKARNSNIAIIFSLKTLKKYN